MKNLYLITLILSTSFLTNAAVLYVHDGSGNAISGSKQALIDAGMAGKQLFVNINSTGSPTYTGNIAQLHSVSGNDVLCLMTETYSANMTSMSSFTSVHAPYLVNYCSDGKNYVRHSNGSFYTNSYTMTWSTPDSASNPTEVMSNDTNGNVTSGVKQDLIDAVNAGKRIAAKINVNGLAVYRGVHTQSHINDICLMIRQNTGNITSPSTFLATHAPYSKNMCTNGKEYVKHVTAVGWTNTFDMTWIVID